MNLWCCGEVDCLLRQFMKAKKHKYGIKLYLLAEPIALILRCNVYSGSTGELGGTGHVAKAVTSLMTGLENTGYSWFMDKSMKND